MLVISPVTYYVNLNIFRKTFRDLGERNSHNPQESYEQEINELETIERRSIRQLNKTSISFIVTLENSLTVLTAQFEALRKVSWLFVCLGLTIQTLEHRQNKRAKHEDVAI